MNREIKFRGKRISNGEWLYGDLMHDTVDGCYVFPIDCAALYKENAILPETIGQYTGLEDKNGKEIYEGDIIRYTDMDSFVVNPDCDPWLHFRRSYAIVREEVVVFEGGMFCTEGEGYPISHLGWESIKDLRECLDIPDNEDCDADGTVIDESLLGIEVIGNIYDNPDLVKQ